MLAATCDDTAPDQAEYIIQVDGEDQGGHIYRQSHGWRKPMVIRYAGVVDGSTHYSTKTWTGPAGAAKGAEKCHGNRRRNPCARHRKCVRAALCVKHVARSNYQRTHRNVRVGMILYRQTMFIRAAGLRALGFRYSETRAPNVLDSEFRRLFSTFSLTSYGETKLATANEIRSENVLFQVIPGISRGPTDRWRDSVGRREGLATRAWKISLVSHHYIRGIRYPERILFDGTLYCSRCRTCYKTLGSQRGTGHFPVWTPY